MFATFLCLHCVAVAALAPGTRPQLTTAKALDVTKFGAVADDGRDDTAAFLAAFRVLKTTAVRRIIIPKGGYDLRADGNPERPDTLFPLADLDGLTIDGRVAELRMTGKAALFSFFNCKNITIRGISVDWKRPPFSEGTVIASTPRSFDIRVLENYPVKGGEPVGAFMTYDPASRLPDGSDLDVYNSVDRTELIAPQILRVHLSRSIDVPVGKLLILRHEVYGHNAIGFYRCANVDVSDVTVYTCPGMAVIGIVCDDVRLKRVKVLNRPGRLMSATADATHFGGCRGTVSYEDCVFEGMGDDGANIKSGLYLTVRKRLDDRTVIGQHNLKMVDLPDAGDLLEMSHVDTLIPFAAGRVRSAKLEPGGENLHRLEFQEPLPPDLREGDVLGNATRVPKLRMRGCTVRANRARGVLCQTRDALIEDCTFENCTGAGVLVLTEVVYFHESIGTRSVSVRNNRFIHCNFGAASAEGALCALAYLKDFAYPKKPGVHRDVTFEGNRIIDTPESGIFAVAVDGLTVRGNRVQNACLRAGRPSGNHAIRVMDCARVSVPGNTILNSGKGQPVLVTGSTDLAPGG